MVAKEIDPPAGSTPVEWRLLTNRTAETLAEVAELIDWYRARWEIEILFHILKNGYRIESRPSKGPAVKGARVEFS